MKQNIMRIRNQFKNINRNAMMYVVAGVTAMLVLSIMYNFVYFSMSEGVSNEPTIKDTEVMIVVETNKNLKRNSFVSAVNSDNEMIQKRIVGMPGDEIRISDGILYINGEADTLFPDADYTDQDMCIKVPADGYFLMGDNRDFSLDSRYYGCFSREDIISKTLFGIY